MQDPIEISSDDEANANDSLDAARNAAANPGLQRTTRSNAYRSTTARFEVRAEPLLKGGLTMQCQLTRSFYLPQRLGDAVAMRLFMQGLKALYPPEGGKGSIQLVATDLSRLDPGEFLNDTVIDYFSK